MAGKPMFFTLRKHLKKSIFAACVSLYGGYYTSGRFREYLVRREICNEASKIGEEPISALQKPRSMYVFLNPAANDGKAVKLYEKDVAPVLHLAGIDVTLIKTDYEGHAKSLPGYIDPNTDGIVIAGGGGTLMEVVTGLIRLQNEDTLSKIPIGVVPLGRNNGFFRNFQKSAAQDARTIGNAAMAIVKGNTKAVDVVEIESEGVRSTYALSSIYWGLFQEVKVKINAKKHWWAGPWKKQMAFVTRTVRNWPQQFLMSLSYAKRPEEFKKNVDQIDDIETQEKSKNHEDTVSFQLYEADGMIKSKKTGNSENSGNIIDRTDINEVETGLSMGEKTADNFELSKSPNQPVKTSGVNLFLQKIDGFSKLHLQVWKPDLKRVEFMTDGWKWIDSNYEIIETNNCCSLLCDELEWSPESADLSWYSIDGEEFEAKPIKIRIHRDKLKFFC